MDGIVLWVDRKSDNAMIWCSDHGDLAYITGTEVIVGGSAMPEVGAMVSVKTRIVNDIRFCYQVTLLQRNAAPDLAQALRKMTAA